MNNLTYQQLQQLLPNDEIHYNDSNSFPHVEYVLYENTVDDFNETIQILNTNNIKYTIETDELFLDSILIH